MERRPALVIVLLAFALFVLVAGRESRFRGELRSRAEALAESLRQNKDSAHMGADALGRLAAPLGFDLAELQRKGSTLRWQRPLEGAWARWPEYDYGVDLDAGHLHLAMPATHWARHLTWSLLLLGFGLGLFLLQRAWEAERREQAEKLRAASSGEAGALRQLQQRLDIERRLAAMQRRLRDAGPAGIDAAISAVLAELAQHAGADRAVLFQYKDGGSRFGVTHGWSAAGVRETGLDGFESLPTDAFPWWREQLAKEQALHVADLAILPPQASAERYLLELRGAKAFLMAPVVSAGERVGFAGMVRVREARGFGAADRELLEGACAAMAESLQRVHGESRAARMAELERAAGRMANRLLDAGSQDLEGTYSDSLGDLARYCRADRAGLWVLQQDGGKVRLFYEWARDPARATIERDRELATAGLPQLLRWLRTGQAWQSGTVERLGPDWEAERIELRRRGANAVLMQGLYAGGHLLGWLSLERLGALDLAEEAVAAASAAASILASALKRERTEAALRASEDRAKVLLAGVPDALLRFSSDGRVLDARLPKGERLPLSGLLGGGLDRLPSVLLGLAPGSVPALKASLATAQRSGRPQTLDLRMDEADGTRYLEWRLVPQDGNETLAIVRDRSLERRQEIEQERLVGNLLAIFNAGTRGLMLLDVDGRVRAFNAAADASAQRDLGVALQAGSNLGANSEPGARAAMGELMARALAGEEPVYEGDLPLPGGRSRLMRIQCLPVFSEDGSVRAICVSLEYQDKLKETREALRISEERYALAAQGSKDGLWDLDLVSGALYVSPRFETMLGLKSGEGPKDLERWVALAHEDDRPSFRDRLQAHLDGRTDHFEAELRLRHAALSDPVWVLLRGAAVRGPDKKALRVAGSLTDINLRKLNESSLLRDALQDPLTGLPNRAVVLDRLGRCDARSRRRQGYHYALLFLDTDDFKTVNQSLGPQAGDQLLKELAQRLERCLRPGDTVGRLGGDEFAIILDEMAAPKDAETVADRVLEACQKPIEMMGRQVYLTVSIGIAINGEDKSNPGDMMRDAETAMVQSKAAGRSQWRQFEPGMLKAAVKRLDLESGLREALERGQFRLHYQPIVDLSNGRLAGYEALARWQHPQRGLIMPGDFIPAAEESGLILPLGRLVLREGLRQWQDWRRAGAPAGMTLSINLSPRQLEDPLLLPELNAALAASQVDPAQLTLEVTESVFMNNRQLATHTLGAIHDLGVGIAIDDFGTGYSSLSYLHQFPAQVLKIDRAFISRMDGLPENEAVTSAVITLGHKLGLKLVAEGVETPLQAARLRALGCGLGQGYLFARPCAPVEAQAYWKKPFEMPGTLEAGTEKP